MASGRFERLRIATQSAERATTAAEKFLRANSFLYRKLDFASTRPDLKEQAVGHGSRVRSAIQEVLRLGGNVNDMLRLRTGAVLNATRLVEFGQTDIDHPTLVKQIASDILLPNAEASIVGILAMRLRTTGDTIGGRPTLWQPESITDVLHFRFSKLPVEQDIGWTVGMTKADLRQTLESEITDHGDQQHWRRKVDNALGACISRFHRLHALANIMTQQSEKLGEILPIPNVTYPQHGEVKANGISSYGITFVAESRRKSMAEPATMPQFEMFRNGGNKLILGGIDDDSKIDIELLELEILERIENIAASVKLGFPKMPQERYF